MGTAAATTSTDPSWPCAAAATLIASLLPDGTASQIRGITAGRELQTTDDLLRPVDNPEISQIAAILPAETTYQTVRAAGKLGFDVVDVLAEVANAATRSTAPAGHQPRAPHPGQSHGADATRPSAARPGQHQLPPAAAHLPHHTRASHPPRRVPGPAAALPPSTIALTIPWPGAASGRTRKSEDYPARSITPNGTSGRRFAR